MAAPRRRTVALAVAFVVVVGVVGIVNHRRMRHDLAGSTKPAQRSSAAPTSSVACFRPLPDSGVALLGVDDVWPGSGGGGAVTSAFDLIGCATPGSAVASSASTCRLGQFSDLSGPDQLYLSGLGATTVRTRALVHAPLAAVTETAVTFPAVDGAGASQLMNMIKSCSPLLPAGLELAAVSTADAGDPRQVVVLEFDDDSLTAALRGRILARAHVLASE